MSQSLTEATEQMEKALATLHLAVDASIANDVAAKVHTVVEELREKLGRCIEQRDAGWVHPEEVKAEINALQDENDKMHVDAWEIMNILHVPLSLPAPPPLYSDTPAAPEWKGHLSEKVAKIVEVNAALLTEIRDLHAAAKRVESSKTRGASLPSDLARPHYVVHIGNWLHLVAKCEPHDGFPTKWLPYDKVDANELSDFVRSLGRKLRKSRSSYELEPDNGGENGLPCEHHGCMHLSKSVFLTASEWKRVWDQAADNPGLFILQQHIGKVLCKHHAGAFQDNDE